MKKVLVATVGAVLFSTPAQAATFQSSREAPFSTTSSGGIGLDASLPAGAFSRIDQTRSFPGGFAVGDALLFTGLSNPEPTKRRC